MSEEKKHTEEVIGLALFGVFQNMINRLCEQMKELKTESFIDLYIQGRIPEKDTLDFLIFIKVCHVKKIYTAKDLCELPVFHRMALAADFYQEQTGVLHATT